MSAPKRIQLRRTRGWRKPEGAVVVARPSKWGNPYRVERMPLSHAGLDKAAAKADPHVVWNPSTAVTMFEDDLLDGLLPFTAADVRRQLAGHDLCCWCPEGQPCHADILLRIANPEVA